MADRIPVFDNLQDVYFDSEFLSYFAKFQSDLCTIIIADRALLQARQRLESGMKNLEKLSEIDTIKLLSSSPGHQVRQSLLIQIYSICGIRDG